MRSGKWNTVGTSLGESLGADETGSDLSTSSNFNGHSSFAALSWDPCLVLVMGTSSPPSPAGGLG